MNGDVRRPQGAAQPATRAAGPIAEPSPATVRLAVDAMGGDRGPVVVLDGLDALLAEAEAAAAPPQDTTADGETASDPSVSDDIDIDGAPGLLAGPEPAVALGPDSPRFLLFGDSSQLEALLADRPRVAARAEIIPCAAEVPMDAKAAEALRSGRDTSMWRAIDAVAEGRAEAVISLGNTVALMTMATVRLRTPPEVSRPAIAALWPSLAPHGAAVMLDLGADLRADGLQLAQYAAMGAEYARIALGLDRPRIALLNVGAEETKGRAELRDAAALIGALCDAGLSADYVGFIEGDRIAHGDADVIVTDGFTGNIALKTAEGTAKLVGQFIREAFDGPVLGRLAGLLIRPALNRLRRRMDPRRVNGGVFLGLNGLVVKSHGGSDAVAFQAAARRALRAAETRVATRIAAQLADLEPARLQRDMGDMGVVAGSG